MPIFKFTALTGEGGVETGLREGDSPRDVRTQLRADNLFATQVEPITEEPQTPSVRHLLLPRLPSRRHVREVGLVTRQFATLIAAGVPLVECLTVLTEQSEDQKMKTVLLDVRDKLTQGMSLAVALSHHPRYFDNLYMAMIEAGEASGELDLIMQRIADYLEKRNRTQQKVITALTYPAIMSAVGVAVVLFLMAFVVPQITGIIRQQGKVLPLPTVILITISNVFRNFWWLFVLALTGGFAGVRVYRASDRGRLVTDALLLKAPLLGALFRKQSVSRFAITFSTLLKSGIPVLDCLEILREVVNNSVLSRALMEVREKITSGTDISTPLKNSGVFPPLVGYMVAVGEESGQLEEILDRIAEAYDQEIDAATERVTRLIEPVLILVMASVVGFIVLSILLPIMQISDL